MHNFNSALHLSGSIMILFFIQTVILYITLTHSLETKIFGLMFVGLSSPLYGYIIYRYLACRRKS